MTDTWCPANCGEGPHVRGCESFPGYVINLYECDCGATWTDKWSCECDDRCPMCNTAVSPSESTWYDEHDNEI